VREVSREERETRIKAKGTKLKAKRRKDEG